MLTSVAFLLRTYKIIICGFLLIVISGVSSLPIFAEPITIEEIRADYEIFEMENDFMKDFEDLDNSINVTVKIYNEDNELVRSGSEKNAMIKDLIKRSDFLTEVGGIEIYRLNK